MQVKEGATELKLMIPQVQNFLPFFVSMDKNGKTRAMDKILFTDVVLVTPADVQASGLFMNNLHFEGAASIRDTKTFAICEKEIKVGNWILAIKNVGTKVIDKATLVLRFKLIWQIKIE